MKERLIKNLGLKILSLFLAFIIWLIVVNVSNPLVNGRREVTLEIENDQVLTAARRAYEIIGKSTVTVGFDVHARDSYKVQPSDFRAYIDLSELYDVTGSVPVKIEVLNNEDIYYNVISRPGVVRVKTEDIQTKPFEVMAEVEGTAANGYDFASVVLTPDTVIVEGPMSQVGLINHVGVKINIDGLSGDGEGNAVLQFYDGNGNELSVDERVHTDVDETGIGYKVNVNKIKEISLDFEVEGTAASGYRFVGVECSKRSIQVTGSRSGLASLNVLVIPSSALNINGAVQDKVVMVDIREYLPEGVQVADSEDPGVEVRMLVEALVTKTIELEQTDISMTGREEGKEYEMKPSQVSVTVQGLKDDLEDLTKDDLSALVDLAGLQEGIHDRNLQFEESDRFTILSYDEFQIEVISPGNQGETVSQFPEPDESGESEEAFAPEETPSAIEAGVSLDGEPQEEEGVTE